jgi:hypothetical protein
MLRHASFHREKETMKMSRESAEDAERRANLLIDWHDFVVRKGVHLQGFKGMEAGG